MSEAAEVGDEVGHERWSGVRIVLRLLVRLAGRNLQNSASFGMNNLFFVAVLIMQGSNSAKSALFAAAPLLLVLGLPLLVTATAGPLNQVPTARFELWPLSSWERLMVRIGSVALSPIVWIGVLLVLLKAGGELTIAFLAVALGLQAVVPVLAPSLRRILRSSVRQLHVRQLRPKDALRLSGESRGGLFRIALLTIRQLLSVLDLYAAALISVAGVLYRLLAPHPKPAAYPILAVVVAIALSTYAQRTFAIDGASGTARYRLLPLRGWQLLLAKDAGYLGVVFILTAGLDLVAGLTFSLVAVAVGRWASLRTSPGLPTGDRARVIRGTFVAGDLGTGLLQIVLGIGLSVAARRVGAGFIGATVALYAASVAGGGWVWERTRETQNEAAPDPRRSRTPR